jgi:thiol-disulfide isomerase/thioredoxin
MQIQKKMPLYQLGRILTQALLLALVLIPLATWAQTVPKLPTQWGESKSGKFTLLDLYSTYCGTCKMMEPYLQRLQFTNGKQLHIKHINADQTATWAGIFKYPITGTPTYILFNPSGQAVYKMEHWISPLILQTQVRRALHELKSVKLPDQSVLPKPLETNPKGWGNMILLAFEHKTGCENCVSHHGELHSMESVGQAAGLKMVYLDTGNLPAWAEPLRPKILPAYMLLDNRQQANTAKPSKNEYEILLNVNGDIDMQTLWQNIALLSDNGIKP